MGFVGSVRKKLDWTNEQGDALLTVSLVIFKVSVWLTVLRLLLRFFHGVAALGRNHQIDDRLLSDEP